MDRSNARAKPRPPKAVVVIVTAVVGVLFTVAGFFWQLDLDPVVNIPTYSVPSPNAFDDYARATALIQDKQEIDTPRSAAQRNMSLTPAAQERVLRDNAPALAAMRQAFTHEYLSPPARTYPVVPLYLPHDREFARLLVVQADVQASHNKWGASARTCLDGLQMDADISHGGGTFQLDAAASIGGMCREPLRRAIGRLSLTEARSVLKRLRAIDANPWTLTQALQEEKWSTQANLIGLYRLPNWRDQFFKDYGYVDNVALRALKLTGRITSKRRVMGDYTQYMDKVIADTRGNRPILPLEPTHSDVFCGVLLFWDDWFIFENLRSRDHYNHAQNDFLEVELALRAYELQNHAYPESLAALTPNLLPNVPSDPFAPGRPIQYRKIGTTYLLYSVGPDGVDDGGRAIFDPKRGMGRSRYSVFDKSKGDIVAGVNF